MRVWLVGFIFCALIALPLSGGGVAVAHEMQGQSLSAEPAFEIAVVVSTEAAENTSAHCDLMAKHASQKHAQQKHTAEIEPSTHEVSSAEHDCCDTEADCGTNCPAECGHCVASSHGGAAALISFTTPITVIVHNLVPSAVSFYSLLAAQTSRPPIIA